MKKKLIRKSFCVRKVSSFLDSVSDRAFCMLQGVAKIFWLNHFPPAILTFFPYLTSCFLNEFVISLLLNCPKNFWGATFILQWHIVTCLLRLLVCHIDCSYVMHIIMNCLVLVAGVNIFVFIPSVCGYSQCSISLFLTIMSTILTKNMCCLAWNFKGCNRFLIGFPICNPSLQSWS